MITIGYSTRKIDPTYIDHIKYTCGIKSAEIIPIENPGKYSLSEAYNIILKKSTNDIVVLVHDDLVFESKNWGHKIKELYRKNSDYGIIGLAGSKFMPESGRWWEVKETMYGIVNHQKDGKKWESKYSKDIKKKLEDVVIIDGLFISLHKERINNTFDETCEGFHFYDIYFSFKNYLSGVKIGVTTSIRVTHLSVGETNDKWEENREIFSKKFSDNLPVDIVNKDDYETFIIIHDQDILLEYEKNNKFKLVDNLKYLFVGNRECNKIKDLDNVIICRDLEYNIEQFPNINSFTAWYALWKNNLITKKYINLFEYDVVLDSKLFVVLPKHIENNIEMIGYIPLSMSNYHFINNPDWVTEIFESIKRQYKRDLHNELSFLISKNENLYWSTTSNTTFKTSVFNNYMEWFIPILSDILNSKYAGHAHERSITFYSYMKQKGLMLTSGLLNHFQMDSHNTQHHKVDYDESITKLINNEVY